MDLCVLRCQSLTLLRKLVTGHINRIEIFSVTTGSVTCWGLESMSPFSFTSQLRIPNCISTVKFFPALGKNHTREYVFGDLTQCLFIPWILYDCPVALYMSF